MLVITAREILGEGSAKRFSSARIRTQDKITFKYGTVEARIRVPDLADGLWPAFWLLGNNFSEVGWPACGEIDIMEMGSGDSIADGTVNRRVGSAAHWRNGDSWASHPMFLDADSDLPGDFHVFRMDWTPEAITTYLDGQQIWTLDIRPDHCSDCSEFHQPHFLILNLAVGGRYTGLLTEGDITAALPAEMSVDYVRIIDNGFTELGGSGVPRDR
jgi:beta-glucanase (GH16 family)